MDSPAVGSTVAVGVDFTVAAGDAVAEVIVECPDRRSLNLLIM
jgi:hypothetical protein